MAILAVMAILAIRNQVFWLWFRYAVSLTPQKCPVYLSFSQEEFMSALTRVAATAGAFAVVLVFAVIGLSVPASGQG